jgi:serine/threonine-protein kinase
MSAPGPCGGRIDRYAVERLLGMGAFGAVYRARHVRTDAEVALKVLKRELMTDTHLLDRFMREARTAAAVSDEHTVRVLDAEITPDGQAFIAMELLDGCDLKDLTVRNKIHPSRVIDLMCQVLTGLQAAHDKGVIHRDMKPANIFVVRKKDDQDREYEVAKVLDFGVSKMHEATKALTLAGTTLGTPGYMAFEQFFDARKVDARTDVYAVAVILYELLSGKKPFDADTLAELINKVRIGDCLPLRTVAPLLPVPVCAVVDKGLAKDRDRRWATARDFAAALERTLDFTGDPPPLPPLTNLRHTSQEVPALDPEISINTLVRAKK